MSINRYGLSEITGLYKPMVFLLFVFTVCHVSCDKDAKSSRGDEQVKIPVVAKEARIEKKKELRRLSGDVNAWELLPLSFKVGGRVSKVLVEEGEEVKEQQLIAIMDARDYWLTRNLARSQVEALKPHLDRAESLYESNALPKSELDKLTGKMRAARIQQRQAQAQLSYVRLRSPISGVILKRLVGTGDMVGPSRPVIAVARMKPVKVVFPVPQGDLKYFEKGMEIVLEASGVEGEFTGKVHHVGYAADASTRTFPVTLAVPNPELTLRVGMIVSARVTVAEHEGIFVPLSAVTRDVKGDTSVLVVSNEGKAMSRKVVLGIRVGEDVQIKDGVSIGNRIIVEGMVSEGDVVKVSSQSIGKKK